MHLTPQTISLFTGIGSIVVPPITSLLKSEKWSTQTKQLIAMVISFIAAIVGLLITQPSIFTQALPAMFGMIFVGSQLFYITYFRKSATDVKLTAVFQKPAAPAQVEAA